MKHEIRLSYLHLQGRDNRAPAHCIKPHHHRSALLILISFLLFVLSVPKYDLNALFLYAAIPVFCIIAGHFPLLLILKRLLLLSPFIIIMAAANPFIDRSPFLEIGGITLSGGMISGLAIILKSVISITAMLTFALCVPFDRICRILHGFRVPDIFITQLLLLYRYSFLLAEEAQTMQKARALRSFGSKGKDLFTTAGLLGSLLLRTHDKANRIYRSMVSRGFNGTLMRQEKISFTVREISVLLSTIAFFTFIRVVF